MDKMSDKELDLIYMFKTIFHMDMFEYYPYKHQFMEHTLHDRVKFTELNKIFHIIIEFFEDRILPYGIGDRTVEKVYISHDVIGAIKNLTNRRLITKQKNKTRTNYTKNKTMNTL